MKSFGGPALPIFRFFFFLAGAAGSAGSRGGFLAAFFLGEILLVGITAKCLLHLGDALVEFFLLSHQFLGFFDLDVVIFLHFIGEIAGGFFQSLGILGKILEHFAEAGRGDEQRLARGCQLGGGKLARAADGALDFVERLVHGLQGAWFVSSGCHQDAGEQRDGGHV